MAGEQSLGGVGERFAGTIDAAAIGRDESVAVGEASSYGKARNASGCGKAGGDELSAGDVAHMRSVGTATRPVIMARTRVQKPARTIMAMWTTRKRRASPEKKKCNVRADCRPPSRLTVAGSAESNAGERARPVQMTRGNRPKITNKYETRCTTL